MSRKKRYLSSPLPLELFFFNSDLPRTATFSSPFFTLKQTIYALRTYKWNSLFIVFIYSNDLQIRALASFTRFSSTLITLRS